MSTNNVIANLPNLDVTVRNDADGNFICYVITVVSDLYVIHDRSGDYTETDDEGNIILYEPYYTYGPSFVMDENYDWEENPRGFEAVLISSLPPDTDILENPKPPTESM